MNALGRIAVQRSRRSVPSSSVSAEHYYCNHLSSDAAAATTDHMAMVSSSYAVTKNQHRRSFHNDISSSSYIYNFTNRDDDDDNNVDGETGRLFQPRRIKCESLAIASSSLLLLFSSSVINRRGGGSAHYTILQNRNQNTPYTNYCQHQQQQHQYYYHTTASHNASGVAIVMTLGALAATAKAGQYAIQGYNEYKAEVESAKAEAMKNGTWKEEEDKGGNGSSNNKYNTSSHQQQTTTEEGGGSTNANNAGTGAATGGSPNEEKVRENIFAKFFDMSVGSKYYEGGFEDKMSRKEAALILGVRESSSTKRIKEAHRKLLILNHPDTGGSTFLSGKINEAKELLLKGKKF